jgi:hypothetical protein
VTRGDVPPPEPWHLAWALMALIALFLVALGLFLALKGVTP